jgi:uncharacterized YccA/Bax inhibitor family protein
MLRTSNPVLSSKSFGGFVEPDHPIAAPVAPGQTMTVAGTINKTAILLALVMVGALWPWHVMKFDPEAALSWMLIGLVGGTVTALIIIFKKDWAGPLAPLYAACEGLSLGGLSALYERRHPGIAFQAVGLTLGVLAAMLVIYRSGAIKVTGRLWTGVVAATGAVAFVYLISMAMQAFGVPVTFLHDTGPVGIGVSMVVILIAALNLILDFDFIEKGAAGGAPKYMEWYGAFGLVLTLVWLYLEILRLLSKLARR